MADEQKISESGRLHNGLAQHLGDNWRCFINLSIRPDVLYWMVNLAEEGMRSREKAWRGEHGRLTSEEAASLASWRMDMDTVITAAICAAAKAAQEKSKGRKRQ